MTDLLRDGLSQHAVQTTSLTRKLTIDGATEAYPVYRIKLDQLYYNDQNDRISTWVSQYRAQHGGRAPEPAEREAYNQIIEGFIVESNPDAIRKTKANIKLVDQREPGVVLNDGRIIDGNRRFTCLRQLSSEDTRFGWFEAVILDRSIERSAKQIKLLELSIQHGEESKVDYDPIDRLVGVYHDLLETGLLTPEEYARSTNESVTDVKKRMELAELMVELLEFINAPGQFYIARDLKLYYPLEELQKLLKKCRTEDEKEDLKNSVFVNILLRPSGDMTRFIRGFKNIMGGEQQEDFLEEQREIAAEVIGILPPPQEMSTQAIRDRVRTREDLSGSLERSMDKYLLRTRKTETRNRPILLAEKATGFLESIDVNILSRLGDSELQRLRRQLDLLEKAADEIRRKLP
nr:ParB/RepB/Spo0J family partition protein [uncultured Oscillibacter sp.]